MGAAKRRPHPYHYLWALPFDIILGVEIYPVDFHPDRARSARRGGESPPFFGPIAGCVCVCGGEPPDWFLLSFPGSPRGLC